MVCSTKITSPMPITRLSPSLAVTFTAASRWMMYRRGATPINVVFSLSGKSPEASLSVPVKHEPIDLFGDSGVLVSRIARGPQRGHPLLEIVVGQTCQEGVGA